MEFRKELTTAAARLWGRAYRVRRCLTRLLQAGRTRAACWEQACAPEVLQRLLRRLPRPMRPAASGAARLWAGLRVLVVRLAWFLSGYPSARRRRDEGHGVGAAEDTLRPLHRLVRRSDPLDRAWLSPQDVRQVCGTGSNSKSRGSGGPAGLGPGEGGADDGCSEDQEDCQNCVRVPLGPAFVRVDIYVRHG